MGYSPVPIEKMDEQREYMDRCREILLSRGGTLYAFVETYGCQQNENDTERLCGMLAQMGYLMIDKKENADLLLYNTCAIRENAENKVYGNIGIAKNLKKVKPSLIVGVCGCMAGHNFTN